MRRTLIGLAFTVILAGCASSGVKVSEEQVAAFKEGVTTEAEVVSAIGMPTGRMRSADGTVTLSYTHAQYSTRPASFIPIVGLFAGGADMSSNTFILTFDKDGKLTSRSSHNTVVNTGTMTGTTYQTNTDGAVGR